MKTQEEMFEYAKHLADTDENVQIAFFFKEYEDIFLFKHLLEPHPFHRYKSKGYIYLYRAPLSEDEVYCRYIGMQCTHIFVGCFVGAVIHGVLRSRCKQYRKTIEPSGIYYPTYVERWESY